MRGVALLVETIEKVQDRLNPDLEVLGILGTFGLLLALLVALSELVRAPALPSVTTSSATQAANPHSAREAL